MYKQRIPLPGVAKKFLQSFTFAGVAWVTLFSALQATPATPEGEYEAFCAFRKMTEEGLELQKKLLAGIFSMRNAGHTVEQTCEELLTPEVEKKIGDWVLKYKNHKYPKLLQYEFEEFCKNKQQRQFFDQRTKQPVSTNMTAWIAETFSGWSPFYRKLMVGKSLGDALAGCIFNHNAFIGTKLDAQTQTADPVPLTATMGLRHRKKNNTAAAKAPQQGKKNS